MATLVWLAAGPIEGVAHATTTTPEASSIQETAHAKATTAEPAHVDSPDSDPTPAVYGVYPLWEETGTGDASGAARIGFRHAQVTLGPVALGTDPSLDLYLTPNAFAKVRALHTDRVSLSLFGRAYFVPAASEQRGFGTVNASPFANAYSPITLWPAGAAVSWLITPRLHAHASATLLTVSSNDAAYRSITGGCAGFVEWFASEQRSVRLHAGTEGWPASGQTHVGMSFGWQQKHFAFAAGYARRFDPGDTSSGVIMWDGTLRFP